MAQSPCSFTFPCWFPFASSSISLYLLGNPPCCDRIPSTLVSGYSQTDLPFLNPSPFLPHSKFPVPRLIVRLTTTTSRSWLLLSGTCTMLGPVCTFCIGSVHVHIFLLIGWVLLLQIVHEYGKFSVRNPRSIDHDHLIVITSSLWIRP